MREREERERARESVFFEVPTSIDKHHFARKGRQARWVSVGVLINSSKVRLLAGYEG